MQTLMQQPLVASPIIQKDKTEKYYMLVCQYNSGETTVEFIQGQPNVRLTIINSLDSIDIHQSFVLVEDVGFGQEDGKPSVYTFLKWIEKNYNDGFDIDEYVQYRIEQEDLNQRIENLQKYHSVGGVIQTHQSEQINDMLYDPEDTNYKELTQNGSK